MELAFHFVLLIGVSLTLAVEPGPGFVKIAYETGKGGKRAGYLAACGMAAGALPHIALVAFGMMAILAQLPGALWALKVAGGIYLIWQAVRMFSAKPTAPVEPPAMESGPDKGRSGGGAGSSFKGGFLLVLLNPRTPATYAAFLPQFLATDAGMPIPVQLLAFGITVATVFLLVDLAFVRLAKRVTSRLGDSPILTRWGRRIGGSLMAAFGLRLILARD